MTSKCGHVSSKIDQNFEFTCNLSFSSLSYPKNFALSKAYFHENPNLWRCYFCTGVVLMWAVSVLWVLTLHQVSLLAILSSSGWSAMVLLMTFNSLLMFPIDSLIAKAQSSKTESVNSHSSAQFCEES